MKKILLLLSIIIGLSLTQTTFASHIPGADIEFECVGPNQYIIRCMFFVKCPAGNSLPSYATRVVSATNTCGLPNQSWTLPCVECGVEVSQLCPPQLPQSSCSNGGLPGVRMWKYQSSVVTLQPCDFWEFSTNICCRNTTVNVSGQPSFYTYTRMYSQTDPCNTSPKWTAQPIPYYCANQQVTHNWGIVEPNGHTIAYSFVDAQQAQNSPVPYNFGYSAVQPFGPSSTINPQTGEIGFNASVIGDYIVAVKATEYNANNQIVSEQVHDVQFTIINCTNQLPQPPQGGITNVTGSGILTPPNKVTLCEGSATCFDLVFTDVDLGDSLFCTSNVTSVLLGSSFTFTGKNPVTATICWTAPPGSQGTYTFDVGANDGACPIPGLTSMGVIVEVTPGILVNLGPDQLIPCNQMTTIVPQISGGSGGYSYLWSNGSTNPIIAVGPGTYWLEVTDTSGTTCIGVDSIVITTDAPTADFTADNVCEGTPVSLFDASTPATNGTIINWQWDIDNNGSTDYVSQNAFHSFSGTGPQSVKFIITDSYGCKDTIVKTVFVNPKPKAGFIGTSLCDGSTIVFADTSSIASGSIATWEWDIDNNGTFEYFTQNFTHGYPSSGLYDVTLIVTSDSGCVDSITVQVNVNVKPNTNFETGQSCANDGMAFIDLTSPTPDGWKWDFGDGTAPAIVQNPIHYYYTPGVYSVKLVTWIGPCYDSLTLLHTVRPVPVVSFETTAPPLRPEKDVQFFDKSDGGDPGGIIEEWYWTFNSEYFSNLKDPIKQFEQDDYEICLTVTNQYSCKAILCENIEVRYEFIIPNIITPNGDGMNDNFVVKALFGDGNKLTIYNRWGDKVYENESYKNDWGATNGSRDLSSGTYYYILITNLGEKFTGHVTVLR